MFLAASQRPSQFYNIVARRQGDDRALLAEMRQVMLSIDPNLLMLETHTMRDHMSVMLLPATAGTTLVMVFCGLGLLLAAVGLYGVIAFSVARRTREIGIRIAIGARPRAVLAGVMRQGLTLAALGLVAGFALAAVVAQVLAGLLYGISPIDPIAWIAATFVLLAVAALANAMPAYRAMQVDPSSALRAE